MKPTMERMEGQRKRVWTCNYILCFLLVDLVSLATKGGAEVPAVIVFGDSSVDAGNNNFIPTVARSNFQPYGRDFPGGRPTGRFSNGRVPTDFLSEAFGLKPLIPAYLDPTYNISDFATGVTFASAATGYDNATSDVLVINEICKLLVFFFSYSGLPLYFLGNSDPFFYNGVNYYFGP